MSDGLQEAGAITTTDVTSGCIAALHDGDGDAVQFWARTESEALQKAQNAAEGDA